MHFPDLPIDPRLQRTLAAMGLREARPIQEAVLPAALEGRPVVALAPTGTGKTLAYGIPIAQRLLRDRPEGTAPVRGGRRPDPRKRLRALVLCPTRELALQVEEALSGLVKGLVLRTLAATGKSAIGPQRAALAEGVDLLVGTPGRVRELLEEDSLSLAFLRQVVVDEADRMLDFGFMPQVRWILERTAAEPQRMLFSATLPREVERLVEIFLPGAERVEVGERNAAAPHLTHRLIDVADGAKVTLLLSLLAGRSGAIVFTRTRRRAGWVAEALRRNGVAMAILHGDRTPAQRRTALNSFVEGRAAVLVATDVAARGLHLPAASIVVNYDLPLLPEEWVHRVGRAGHGGDRGESISLRTPQERERWKAIERIAGVKLAAERSGVAAPESPRSAAKGHGAKSPGAKGARPRGSAAGPAQPASAKTVRSATKKRPSSARPATGAGRRAATKRREKAPPRVGKGVVRPGE